MGFGLLFLGYLTFLSFKIMPAGLIGTALMYFGLSKLCTHAPYFNKAKKLSAAYFIYYLIFTALWILNMTGVFDSLGKFQSKLIWFADSAVHGILFFVFSLVLCKALEQICNEVGYEKGIKKQRLCGAFLNVFALGTVLRLALYFTNFGNILQMPVMLVELLSIVSVSAWIYSCYMMIATQEIIDDETEKIRKYDEKHYSNRKSKK